MKSQETLRVSRLFAGFSDLGDADAFLSDFSIIIGNASTITDNRNIISDQVAII